jgi:membrane protease YdiL (CAAX protease family)
MASDFDPYRILEVDPSAGQKQIDEAYRRQWAAYPRDDAPEARLREIQAAYRILSDPAERHSYDERRAAMVSAPTAVAEWPPEHPVPPAVREDTPWTLLDMACAIGVLIGLGIFVLVPFAVISAVVAGSQDKVEDDPTALAIGFLGGAFLEFLFIGVVWWFSVRKYHITWSDFGFRRPQRGWPWLPFTLVLVAFALVATYGVITSLIGWEPDTDLPKATYDNALPFSIAFVLAVFVAPIAEEVLFRAFIFKGLLKRLGFVPAALLGGCAFGLAHVFNPGGLFIFLPISMIGVLFCWGYYYSRSLTTTIAAHFVFNLLQMLVAFSTR